MLRSHTPDGVEQEIWALLALYQALRIAITGGAETVPGVDSDRAAFTTAVQTARDQLILAAGVIAGTTIDLAGTIGHAVLAGLLPARRLRVSPRTVKRPTSRYAYIGMNQSKTSHTVTIEVTINETGGLLTPRPAP